MEEIITVDEKQYVLIYDQPLTEEQMMQTIADIKKQSCRTCGTRTIQPKAMDPNWIYGGIQSLVPTKDATPSTNCPVAAKRSGDTIDLSIQPDAGIGPYKTWFYIHHNVGDRGTIIDPTRLTMPGAPYADPIGVTGIQPYTNIPELGIFRRTYTLNDLDISSATDDPGATQPIDVDSTTGALTFGTTGVPKGPAVIRLYTAVVDSCTGTTGPAACIQWCDVTLACVPPTCNFIVT